MPYFLAPLVISYLLFVFVAEHLNPLKTYREVGKRHRIRDGRRIALASLPIGYAMVFALHYLTTATAA